MVDYQPMTLADLGTLLTGRDDRGRWRIRARLLLEDSLGGEPGR